MVTDSLYLIIQKKKFLSNMLVYYQILYDLYIKDWLTDCPFKKQVFIKFIFLSQKREKNESRTRFAQSSTQRGWGRVVGWGRATLVNFCITTHTHTHNL